MWKTRISTRNHLRYTLVAYNDKAGYEGKATDKTGCLVNMSLIKQGFAASYGLI